MNRRLRRWRKEITERERVAHAIQEAMEGETRRQNEVSEWRKCRESGGMQKHSAFCMDKAIAMHKAWLEASMQRLAESAENPLGIAISNSNAKPMDEQARSEHAQRHSADPYKSGPEEEAVKIRDITSTMLKMWRGEKIEREEESSRINSNVGTDLTSPLACAAEKDGDISTVSHVQSELLLGSHDYRDERETVMFDVERAQAMLE